MKSTRFLERSLFVFETLHLAQMSWCLSLPLLFLFPHEGELATLLWGLGAAVPVLLIRALTLRLQQRWKRLLAGLGVTLASIWLGPELARLCYGICGLILTVIGTWLPRPDGKLVLSVPKLYHAVFMLLTYAFGRITENEFFIDAAVVLALIFCVNYLLHRNALRLLDSLRDDPAAEISGQSIVALNRKLIISLVLAGTLLILLLPWLLSLRQQTPEPAPVRIVGTEPLSETPQTEPTEPPDLGSALLTPPSSVPVDLSVPLNAVEFLFLVLVAAVLVLVLIAAFDLTRFLRDDPARHRSPAEQGFVVERLSAEPSAAAAPKAPSDNWQRRIRRQYRQLISGRAGRNADLAALSPEELETAAGLPQCGERRTLHELYEQARYGPDACTKEDFRRARAAAKALDRQAADK